MADNFGVKPTEAGVTTAIGAIGKRLPFQIYHLAFLLYYSSICCLTPLWSIFMQKNKYFVLFYLQM